MSEDLLDILNEFADALEAATVKLRENIKQIQKKPDNPQLLDKLNLPNELKTLLNAETKENMVILKPKRYLGTENFSKIMEALKPYEGKYVSQGKNSHFTIPLEKVKQ